MSKSVRYSSINCPYCRKSFKFIDNFESRKPTGQLMKCPKCRFMFAFHVVNEAEQVPEQIPLKFTANVDDSGAFDRFVQEIQNSSEITKESNER